MTDDACSGCPSPHEALSTGIAGLGHELTLLPQAGPSSRIRPAGRDGTGDGRGETIPTPGAVRPGEELRSRLRAEAAWVEQGELRRRNGLRHVLSLLLNNSNMSGNYPVSDMFRRPILPRLDGSDGTASIPQRT